MHIFKWTKAKPEHITTHTNVGVENKLRNELVLQLQQQQQQPHQQQQHRQQNPQQDKLN